MVVVMYQVSTAQQQCQYVLATADLTLSSVQTLDKLTSHPQTFTMINRVRLKLWNHWFWNTIVMGNNQKRRFYINM